MNLSQLSPSFLIFLVILAVLTVEIVAQSTGANSSSTGPVSTESVSSGSVSSGSVSSGSVSSGSVSSGSVSSGSVSSGSVSSGSVSSGSASSGSVSSGAVSSGAVSSGAVSSGAVSLGAVSSGAVSSGAVSSGAVSSGAVSSGSVSSGAVSSGAVSSGAVSSGAVSPGAVSSGAVSSGAVSSGAVSPASVSSGAVSPGAVSSGAVSPGAVSSGAVSPASVSSGAVSPGAVTSGSASMGPPITSATGSVPLGNSSTIFFTTNSVATAYSVTGSPETASATISAPSNGPTATASVGIGSTATGPSTTVFTATGTSATVSPSTGFPTTGSPATASTPTNSAPAASTTTGFTLAGLSTAGLVGTPLIAISNTTTRISLPINSTIGVGSIPISNSTFITIAAMNGSTFPVPATVISGTVGGNGSVFPFVPVISNTTGSNNVSPSAVGTGVSSQNNSSMVTMAPVTASIIIPNITLIETIPSYTINNINPSIVGPLLPSFTPIVSTSGSGGSELLKLPSDSMDSIITTSSVITGLIDTYKPTIDRLNPVFVKYKGNTGSVGTPAPISAIVAARAALQEVIDFNTKLKSGEISVASNMTNYLTRLVAAVETTTNALGNDTSQIKDLAALAETSYLQASSKLSADSAKLTQMQAEARQIKRSLSSRYKCLSSVVVFKDTFYNRDPNVTVSNILCPGNFSGTPPTNRGVFANSYTQTSIGPKFDFTFSGLAVPGGKNSIVGFRVTFQKSVCQCGKYFRPRKFKQACGFEGPGVATVSDFTGECLYYMKAHAGNMLRVSYQNFPGTLQNGKCSGTTLETSEIAQTFDSKTYCGNSIPNRDLSSKFLLRSNGTGGLVKLVSVNRQGADTFDVEYQTECICGTSAVKVSRDIAVGSRIINGGSPSATCYLAVIKKYNPNFDMASYCQGVVISRNSLITSTSCVGAGDQIQEIKIGNEVFPLGSVSSNGEISVMIVSKPIEIVSKQKPTAPYCALCLPCSDNSLPVTGMAGVSVGIGSLAGPNSAAEPPRAYNGKIADCTAAQSTTFGDFCVSPSNSSQYGCSGPPTGGNNRKSDDGAPFITPVTRRGYVDHAVVTGLLSNTWCLTSKQGNPSDKYISVAKNVPFIFQAMSKWGNICPPPV